MDKDELYQKIMQAIELIEDGGVITAKKLLEELAHQITFMK